jgi:hypothetical protein
MKLEELLNKKKIKISKNKKSNEIHVEITQLKVMYAFKLN